MSDHEGKRTLVCGGRDYRDYRRIFEVLSSLEPSMVIHGDARGADTGADIWAVVHGVPFQRCPADWARGGHAAGPVRNAEMLRDHKPELVVAFPGGYGTANMVLQAEDAGVEVLRIEEVEAG